MKARFTEAVSPWAHWTCSAWSPGRGWTPGGGANGHVMPDEHPSPFKYESNGVTAPMCLASCDGLECLSSFYWKASALFHCFFIWNSYWTLVSGMVQVLRSSTFWLHINIWLSTIPQLHVKIAICWTQFFLADAVPSCVYPSSFSWHVEGRCQHMSGLFYSSREASI